MKRDRVSPETHAAVLVRDRACVLSKIEPDHLCRDQWGNPHASTDLARMSLEHVKSQPMMGRRAPSDMAHLVTMCHASNVGVPSKSQRAAIRAYLEAVA